MTIILLIKTEIKVNINKMLGDDNKKIETTKPTLKLQVNKSDLNINKNLVVNNHLDNLQHIK